MLGSVSTRFNREMVGHNLWRSYFGVEHPFATYFDVHQGYDLGFGPQPNEDASGRGPDTKTAARGLALQLLEAAALSLMWHAPRRREAGAWGEAAASWALGLGWVLGLVCVSFFGFFGRNERSEKEARQRGKTAFLGANTFDHFFSGTKLTHSLLDRLVVVFWMCWHKDTRIR